MAGSLTLDSWPQAVGFDTASYLSRMQELFQFGPPSVPGVLPSRTEDIGGSYTDELKVAGDSTGMQVKVSQGRVIAKGIFAKVPDASVSGGVYTLTVTAAHATLQRIDRVIVEVALATGVATLKMSNGTTAASGSAVPTALTQNATTWQIPLALVVVDPAVVTIAAIDVIDNRVFSYTVDSLMRALAIANPIINGGMPVWNDGTSFAAIADATYAAEMWRYGKVGAVVHTLTQDTDVPSVAQDVGKESYSSKLDVTTADSSIAAGDYCIYEQRIEGYRAKRLLQRGFTLGFWAKQPAVGVYYVAFVNSGGDRSCVCPYFIETADTWEWHFVHVPASPTAGTWDYTTGIGVRSVFTLSCGSTFQTNAHGTWQTGLFYGTSRQFNATGSTAYNTFLAMVGRMSLGGLALPFSPHDDEETLTKRYYEVIGSVAFESIGAGEASASTLGNVMVPYVTKRAAPSASISTGSDFALSDGAGSTVASTGMSGNTPGLSRMTANFSVASGLTAGRGTRLLAANTSARLKLNARL